LNRAHILFLFLSHQKKKPNTAERSVSGLIFEGGYIPEFRVRETLDLLVIFIGLPENHQNRIKGIA
jgi:hypothetical protein